MEGDKVNCPECNEPIQLPAQHWPSQWPPYVCGACGAHWGVRQGTDRPFLIERDIQPLWPLMSWQHAAKWAQCNGLRPYVYAITYPNGLPFYVGKGNGHRLMQHAAFLRLTDLWAKVKKPRNEKEAIIWHLARTRDYERYAILAICQSDQEAFDLEAVAIYRYGRRESGGLLANVTYAAGPSGQPMPPMPDLGEIVSDGWYPWDLSPDINARATSQYGGLIQWCPACDEPSMRCRTTEPANRQTCPTCFHPFQLVDERKLRKWIPDEAMQKLRNYDQPELHHGN